MIRVFPRRTNATPTDPMAFVGDPPFPDWIPRTDEIHVSVTFTWDLEEGRRLQRAWQEVCYWANVKLGGPALGDPGGVFVTGRYVKPGYTITSRGCPNHCAFCLVPCREGGIRELDPVAPGNNVIDNNLLACSDEHIDRVLAMLAQQPKAAVFSGGLEAALLLQWTGNDVYERWSNVRTDVMFLAYDLPSRWEIVERAIRHASYWWGLGNDPRRLRVYVLAGFGDDTPEAAEERCKQVMRTGKALPFMMLWQPNDRFIEHGTDWRRLQRRYVQPAAMMAMLREEKEACDADSGS